MQDFIDQAKKNDVMLIATGNCQFCGAELRGGVFECVDVYSNIQNLLDFSNANYHIPRFLSVDAHALQHPEIHGRWSNHFHLTRLHLILVRKVKWDYKISPQLSNYLNEYKVNNPTEMLAPPPLLNRGKMTAQDLTKATTADECTNVIQQWAEEVYQTWSTHHGVVSGIAEGFLGHTSFIYTKHDPTQ